jgi:hypothetical protein
MSLILSGTDGLSDVDGSAATPAIRGTDANTGIFFPAADTIAFAEGGAECARFDSSGNFGLGVTPSAWNGSYKGFQVGSAALFSGVGGSGGYFLGNAYFGVSGYVYQNTAAATRYEMVSGQHAWSVAPSGTAGNAITFTQAMTLTNSSELALGGTTVYNAASGRVSVNLSGSTMALFMGNGTTRAGTIYHDNSDMEIANHKNGYLSFKTNDTERARIFSGGGISVFSATTANDTIDSCNNQAAGTTYSTFIGRHSATTITTGTVSCRIYTNGNIINTNNSYGQISDIKLKENIVDATPKLEKLNQVRVVNFNFIGDQQKQLGVVAQELEQVFPSMVDESPDRDEEGNDLGTVTKSVKYSVFVPMLIKAIQELNAKFEEYKAAHP